MANEPKQNSVEIVGDRGSCDHLGQLPLNSTEFVTGKTGVVFAKTTLKYPDPVRGPHSLVTLRAVNEFTVGTTGWEPLKCSPFVINVVARREWLCKLILHLCCRLFKCGIFFLKLYNFILQSLCLVAPQLDTLAQRGIHLHRPDPVSDVLNQSSH